MRNVCFFGGKALLMVFDISKRMGTPWFPAQTSPVRKGWNSHTNLCPPCAIHPGRVFDCTISHWGFSPTMLIFCKVGLIAIQTVTMLLYSLSECLNCMVIFGWVRLHAPGAPKNCARTQPKKNYVYCFFSLYRLHPTMCSSDVCGILRIWILFTTMCRFWSYQFISQWACPKLGNPIFQPQNFLDATYFRPILV